MGDRPDIVGVAPPMRIALLTPEHPSEHPDRGGLASYVDRMACCLLNAGHQPEIFLASEHASETISYNGMLLHRVNSRVDHPVLDHIRRNGRKYCPDRYWYPFVQPALNLMIVARGLAHALERRHAIAPFQLVQSADLHAVGLLVRRRRERVHIVRCSYAADLYNRYDNYTDMCREHLERFAIRRADNAYAPSRYVAIHFQKKYGIDVKLIRPPAYFAALEAQEPSVQLPARFFLHFGHLSPRKGTQLLAAALPIAWEKAPDLTMVWCGATPEVTKLREWHSLWGKRGDQVQITGPLSRPQMYAVLRRADASVLPSQADNLPNTVIESLMLGVPVIGSRGASIDELVEDGRTGHLVPLGDPHSLADTLAMMWLRRSPVSKGFAWRSELAQEMEPERAVTNLVNFASAPGRCARAGKRSALRLSAQDSVCEAKSSDRAMQ